MGIVVIHAGMPKTGSTSLQRWLAEGHRRLRAEHGVRVLVAQPWRLGSRVRVRLAPPRLGTADSRRFGELWTPEDEDQAAGVDLGAAAQSFFASLDAAASEGGTTVVSSEALAVPLSLEDHRFLAGLDDLGRRHSVRVALYVRPQDSALEAAWRQWGFRTRAWPSRFLGRRAARLHYLRTYRGVTALAPSVRLEPRPFREDLLRSGSVVSDFARHFLGLDADAGAAELERDVRLNRAAPLEVVNALRGEALWGSRHDNRRFEALKRLVGDLDLPESEATRRSRLVLRAYAHRTFEEENRKLIAEIGWPAEGFVPPLPEGEPAPDGEDLSELDRLWLPQASAAELELLRAAVAHATSVGGSLRLWRAKLRRAG